MVAPSILRQKKLSSLDRSVIAANALAEEYPEVAEKAESLRDVRGRDPLHTEAFRLEALADLLEAVVECVLGEEPEALGEDERPLEEVDGIGSELAATLREAGYAKPDDLRKASDEELLKAEGVGKATLQKIRADL